MSDKDSLDELSNSRSSDDSLENWDKNESRIQIDEDDYQKLAFTEEFKESVNSDRKTFRPISE